MFPNCGLLAHHQSWSLSDGPQRYSPSWRSQNRSYKSVQTPLDQFLNTPLLNKLRHRQGGGGKASTQGRLVSDVDHARIGKIIPPANISHLQSSAGKFIKCLLLKTLMLPSLYINNNRATEWGTICQRSESIFTRPTPCGRIHGTNWVSGALVGPLPVGPLAPPIVPCLCWSPPGTYLPHHQSCPLVTQTPSTQAPVVHNRTNALPFRLDTGEQRWGSTSMVEWAK